MSIFNTLLLAAAGLGLFLFGAVVKAAEPAPQPTPAIPAPTIDTNGDGKPDAWDRNADGKADAWDLDGDGAPDAVDDDGDGKPDVSKSR
jgi:hypothetical protein